MGEKKIRNRTIARIISQIIINFSSEKLDRETDRVCVLYVSNSNIFFFFFARKHYLNIILKYSCTGKLYVYVLKKRKQISP